MAGAELINEHIIQVVILNLSYIAEGLMILNIILISACFLGRNIKLNKRTFIYPAIFVAVGCIYNTICLINIIRYIQNSPEGILDVARNEQAEEIISNISMGLFLITSAATGMTVYKKYKILRGLETVLMIFIVETYLQSLILTAYSYLTVKKTPFDKLLDNTLSNESTYVYILAYFAISLILFITIYFGLYKKQTFINIKWKYRVLFIIWELVMLYGMVLPGFDEVSNGDTMVRMSRLLGVLLPVLGIGVPFVLLLMVSRRSAVEKNIIQESYISAELDYIKQYKKSQEETRAFRHDIINNMSLISVMMKDKKYGDAEEYIDTLLGNVRAMSPKYITGDEMLDCIVGMKSSRMDESGIDFIIDGVLDGGLGMKPVDVCTLFANAIDNAIEACERMPEDKERYIRLQMKKTEKFFTVKIINSFYEEDGNISIAKILDGSRQTSKKDKNLHGYGTINMKSVINRYDGMMKTEVRDGEFILSVIIPR